MRLAWYCYSAVSILLLAIYVTGPRFAAISNFLSGEKRESTSESKMPPKGKAFFNDGREVALHQYVFAQDLDKLRGNPAAVMGVMDQYMEEHGHMMTFAPSKIAVAVSILEKSRPKTIVELGTYVGFSALAWGKMIQDFHGNGDLSNCKVVTMELSKEFAKITSDFIELAGLDDIVQVVCGQSADSLRNLASSYNVSKVDYLFIDHWEKYYLSDLQLCEELGLFHSDSVIIADNTDMPGAPDYVRYVKAGGSGQYHYISTTYPTEGKKGHPNVLEVTVVE